MEMLYKKQRELTKKLQNMWRRPGWRDVRRASRERRVDTIQQKRQMGVITVASRIERLTDNM